MDWLKQHFDRVILAVIGLLVLVFAGLIISNILSFGELFEAQKNTRPPNNEIPPLPTEQLAKRIESLKKPSQWDVHSEAGSLFVSEPYISVDGGPPENIFREGSQPVFPPIDNKWIVEHGLNFSSPTLLNDDPDGDKFTNLEEFLAKTDPNNPASQPGYVSKLRLQEWVKTPFRLKFSGSPDNGTTFTINTLDLSKPTQFLKIGEMVEGSPYKVLSYEEKSVSEGELKKNISELTVENTEDGQKVVLVYDTVVNSPTEYAQFKYLWDGSEPRVKKLDTFSLEPEKDTKYKLIDISDTEAVIENVETKEKITVLKAE